MNLNIVGVIPARGGSKRLPKKNLRLLNGKPLIAYTIEEAKKSKLLTSFYVSTEDKKISKTAQNYGAQIISRPKKLAKDTTQSYLVIQDAVKKIEKNTKKTVDIVVLLQPTSPLRKHFDIDSSIKQFIKNKCDSLVSVTEACFPPEFMYKFKNKKLRPILKTKLKSKRTQDMPKTFQINGVVYVTKRNLLMKKNTLLSKNPCPYFMPFERSIDINSIFDFKLAEIMIKEISQF